MAELDGSGGGTVGKLWRRHGGGYYAALAVGTFLYLEFVDVVDSVANAATVSDFITSELLTFVIDTFLNTLMASIWPIAWYMGMGVEAFYWAGGGYALWAAFIAFALAGRERQMKKDLGV